MQEVSSQAEELLGAQEVRCSMEFIISASVSVHVIWKRLKQVLIFFRLGDSPGLFADVSEHCQLHHL